MIAQRKLIGTGSMAVVAGLVLGAVLGVSVTFSGSVSAQEFGLSVTTRNVVTNTEVETLKAQLEEAVSREIANGCTQPARQGSNELMLCGESKARISALEERLTQAVYAHQKRSPEEVRKVEANIRALAGKGDVSLSFTGSAVNPYVQNEKRIEFYLGSDGNSYWVNPAANEVVQFGAAGKGSEPKGTRLSEEELKSIAVSFLAKNVPNFAEVQGSYQYQLNDCRKDDSVCSFRWEQSASTDKNNMSPFVQVVVQTDGSIGSFTNTQSLYAN